VKHFLAYGNSDQVSFRDPGVRASFQFMSVPGTIAAYYEDATAAFVLSSNLDYSIDPRTPLFQEDLPAPRASHFTLAQWLGSAVSARLNDHPAGAYFPAAFYTRDVVAEMVESLLGKQLDYSGRAPVVRKKMDRYRQLLLQASGRSADAPGAEVRAPAFILAPYFAVRDTENDPWWAVSRSVLDVCASRADAAAISPVSAVAKVNLLDSALTAVPDELSRTQFFWVTDFDERRVSTDELTSLWQTVREHSNRGRRLVNLYGGFFSICMQHAGLWGFNNGLGYSESRAWPQLTSTGAAPPRYYIRRLHAFAPPAQAQLLIEADPSFGCPCSACSGRSPVDMSYHLLKRHFALARQWELELVNARTVAELESLLQQAAADFGRARPALPGSLGLKSDHLVTWAAALRSV
jgi:hypothetical protein